MIRAILGAIGSGIGRRVQLIVARLAEDNTARLAEDGTARLTEQF